MRATVLLSLTGLLAGSLSAQSLDAERLFDPGHLVDVRIELAEKDWDEIRVQTRVFTEALGKTPAPNPYRYVKAKATIDGIEFPRVSVRKKGFIGSLDDERPSLKIRFPKGSPISGFDRLTLNNNKQDRSLVSQALGFKLFRDCGLAAPRCNLAKVTVNGTYLGIYSNVESVRRPFIERSFGDASGHLYEGTVADLFTDRIEKFELKTRGTDRVHLERIARVLESEKIDLEELEKHLDVKTFIRFWALESLMGFWDGYTQDQNNYFMYRKPANEKLYFIPWGLDDAFTNTMPIPPYRVKVKSVYCNALLAVRLHANEKARETYRQTLVSLLEDHWNEKTLNADIDGLEKLITSAPHPYQDDASKALHKVRRFIAKRREDIEAELKEWPLDVKTEPRLPAYFKRVGEGAAKFETKWNERAPSKPIENGKGELLLAIGGKDVEFSKLGVSAERSTWPQGPGERGPQPPTIVFTARRKSDNKKVVVALTIPNEHFVVGEKSIKVSGVMFEGPLGFLDWKSMKMLAGDMVLEAASTKEGEPVKGRVVFTCARLIGGW